MISLTKRRVKLLEFANESFREADQVKCAYADIHKNIKIMLRYPAQRKYLLGIQSENVTANILSRLDYESERFDEIYYSGSIWSLYLSLQSVVIFTVQHDERNKLYMEVGTEHCWTDLVTHLHLQFTLAISYVFWKQIQRLIQS